MELPIISTYRSCPICNSHTAEILHQQLFAEKMLGILPRSYNIVRCQDCGFIFDDMEADAECFARYYNISAKYASTQTIGGGSLTCADKERFQLVFNLISPYLKNNEQPIADIGAGNGGLLKYFYDNGYKNVTAYEVAASCIEYIHKNYQFNAIMTDINNIQSNKSYDLILCSQVFEHLYYPQKVLYKLSEMVSDNGLLYLEMPDATRYDECFVSPFHFFDVEHINHFSVEYIEYLLSLRNFIILEYGTFDFAMAKNIVYPNFYCLAQKSQTNVVKNKTSTKKTSTKLFRKIQNYLKISKNENEKKKLLLKNITGPVCLWGIGAYALRLLQDGVFDRCSLVALVDIDKTKQGTKIGNLEIVPPEYIYNKSDITVIITSVLYEKDIIKLLKDNHFSGSVIVYT